MIKTMLIERIVPLSFTVVLATLPAHANEALIAAGEQQALVCKACHQIEEGGVTVVGPPLWGLAERNIAGFDGYPYSEALKKHTGSWDASSLDAFLAAPSEFSPGTNMVFPGVKDPGARAAIIAWLATKNPTPPDWVTASSGTEIKSVGDGILTPDDNMTLVAAACSSCHSLHLVVQQGLSKDSWDETLEWMVDEQGMDPLPAEEHEKVLIYLAKHYGE
ncbi:c-type cytochrome [Enterovibrio sp. ZSDZ35]|uniref:C-type cytochrome n=1 Tax=Enterovibrio qingdaonensis TaxID=2899818 RepID=A0ABT5QKA4_9GAMM|nr:c-type cytochrome [Enterovibrio sp. ZSDZ35]MDD1781034.1 c-type cytochrome [Enterovibrio sp. ZSDZ35]